MTILLICLFNRLIPKFKKNIAINIILQILFVTIFCIYQQELHSKYGWQGNY